MTLKHILATGMIAGLGLGLLPARTWTSADGSKTFEGELGRYDKATGKVTVILKRNGRSTTFAIDKLSDADKSFLAIAHLVSKNPSVLKQGARLAIVGDSITEQKQYSKFIETYLLACMPHLEVQCLQFGWSGETAPGFANRMENDLVPW